MFSSKDLFFTPAAGGYTVSKSLRFRSSATAYLNRTFGTPTTQNVFTCSFWLKRGKISTQTCLFGESGISSNGLYFDAGDTLSLYFASSIVLTTAAVFRDPSAWYHVIWTSNGSTQTIYVNGVSRASGTASQTRINSAIATYIMSQTAGSIPTDGYLAEFNFIDGAAKQPTDFGAYDTNGIWQPAAYTGSYGNNGFYLKFTDVGATSGSNTGYGKDFAGTNYWTTNNFGTTSTSSTYDSMLDSPTNAAGDIGNYAVLNPLDKHANVTVSNGNLSFAVSTAANFGGIRGTLAISQKSYWEVTNTCGLVPIFIGILSGSVNVIGTADLFSVSGQATYRADNGNKNINGTASAYGATYTTNDIIGVTYDPDTGELTFYKNNSTQGTISTGFSGYNYFPAVYDSTSSATSADFNFGQRPFAYTPPSGYSALNTQNLTTPTITNGAQYMAAALYNGNGATQAITNGSNNNAGTTFQPDFVWLKSRSSAFSNYLFDVLRGSASGLISNSTAAQDTGFSNQSFDSNGFTVSTFNTSAVNASGSTYVMWQWKGGGTGVTNTSGSITSTVSANTSAGFSVVTFTAPASGSFTVGHGLGVTPAMLIVKPRTNATYNWSVAHQNLTNTTSYYLSLNLTNAQINLANMWGTAGWNSTTLGLTVGNSAYASDTHVAYCFAPVAGYSSFGSYTGNGSADGPFIYTGFRPRFIMIKRTDVANDWVILDTSRDSYNVAISSLFPNSSSAETANGFYNTDILSNGFKIRATNAVVNASGGTYIYAAFAENPFKISRAR